MNKKKTYKILLFIFTILLILTVIELKSQSCTGFYRSKDCVSYVRKGFNLSGQSRSATLEIGATSQFDIVLNGGRDYIISCCTEEDFYPINFKILTLEGNEVVYDNMQDEYMSSIGFTLDNTQTVRVIITLLADEKDPLDFDENRACVGIAIQFRKTPQLGF
jgi:hypothetical protein